MITPTYRVRHSQRGVVLVSSLLLLLVVTIMALSMFRSFGIQEKIAGNMREKQRALQAAESAQQYAEVWLISNAATSAPVVCAAQLNANAAQGQICSNKLWQVVPSVTTLPWQIAGANVGVTYVPPTMTVAAASASNANAYFGAPIFYISDAGASFDPNVPGEVYQIDAAGYGGNGNTVAVVESTYAVYSSSSNRGGP
ncbi:MAG TPA: PilX N-terminal domain-containing pilus assembly protein [Steroidobacteraceae bacterium]|jgi:type IV pilus assembly protein PilX|nr:PilX N-terminal domain-containing pilus assembly protein [Steroidobacteraceae bacterium]